ncbi:MAG: hypothetical protein KGI73_01330 [Patescibacteria group bacterium]|nr:hypothetical protein [Patescibacteria group bacterium]
MWKRPIPIRRIYEKWKRVIWAWGMIIVLTVVSGLAFYPPTTISIPFWQQNTLAKPISLLSFAAQVFQIPGAIKDYEVSISYTPPKDCIEHSYPNSVAEFSFPSGNPLVPYFQQAFATSSCMNIWPEKNAGLPQNVNGNYVFCLPEDGSIHFTYPADQTIFLAVPGTWWNDKCSAFDSNGIVDSSKYFHLFATPEIGEVVIGWLGLLLLWIVTMGSVITLCEWSKPRK